MIRVEIIANHSVEENILEALKVENAGKYYTRFPGVYGVGRQGPRMGDAIWPEDNFALVIWCEMPEAEAVERAVKAVKTRFPNEGIKLFGLPDPAALQLPPPEARSGPAENTAPAGESARAGTAAAGAGPDAAAPAPPPPAPNFGGESF